MNKKIRDQVRTVEGWYKGRKRNGGIKSPNNIQIYNVDTVP